MIVIPSLDIPAKTRMKKRQDPGPSEKATKKQKVVAAFPPPLPLYLLLLLFLYSKFVFNRYD